MSVPARDELREFIEDPLRAKLEANRSVRRRQSRRTKIFTTAYLVLSVTVTFAVTVALGMGSNEGFWATYWISFALVGGWIALYSVAWYRYIADEEPFDYRDEIVAPVLFYIAPRLELRPDGDLEKAVAESGLFVESVDSIEHGDIYRGTHGGIELRIAEVVVEESAGFVGGQPALRFEGLLFVADYSEEVDGDFALIPAESSEHPAVEEWPPATEHLRGEVFDPWSEDEKDASSPLDDSLVDRLRKIRSIIGEEGDSSPVAVSVVGSRMYAAIPGTDYFGPPADGDDVDTSHLHRVGRQISLLVDIAGRLEAAPPVSKR